MQRFDLTSTLSADCVVADDLRAGEIYHVERNASGGAILTPIASYYAWKPQFIEGFHAHWRVDCYTRQHELAPQPKLLGELLIESLQRESLCEKPIWLSFYECNELGGQAYGEVFDFD